MRLFNRFEVKQITLFKLDLMIRRQRICWFEFRILGIGIDIDYSPHMVKGQRWKIYPVIMDFQHLIYQRWRENLKRRAN